MKRNGESDEQYVRGLIERDYRDWQRRAANQYQQFLADHPKERAAMEAWELADAEISPPDCAD